MFCRPENPNLKMHTSRLGYRLQSLHCAYDLGLGVSALDRIQKTEFKRSNFKDLIESSKDRIERSTNKAINIARRQGRLF